MRGEAIEADSGKVSLSARAAALPWQARMVLLAAIWGLSFLFIKVGDESLTPLQVALGRMIFGTGILLLIQAIRREPLPRSATLWGQLAIAAILFNAAPFTLFAYGETRTTSVLAGIWNATTPLLTVITVAVSLSDQRPSRTQIAGLIVGFAGVLMVLGPWRGVGGHEFIGNLACLAAAACYALGFPFTRRYLAGRPESTVVLAAAQLLCGTVELAIVAPFFSGLPSNVPLKVGASILALGAVGTGIGYVINYSLIRDAGPTNASTVTYIVPLFSTVVGVVVLSEALTWNEPVGGLIVILGVALSQGRLGSLLRRVRR